MTAQPVHAPPLVLTSKGVEIRQPDGPEGSRWYADPQTDELYASVTTAISACTSKPWLVQWGSKLAAECAVDEHVLLDAMLAPRPTDADLSPAEVAALALERRAGAVDYVKGAAKRKREAASERGTWVHDVVEALVLDQPIPDLPKDVAPYVDQFIEWWCDFVPVPFMSEATVCNPGRGYAGTLDLGAHLPTLNLRAIIDVKTGANVDLYMPVQLAAYRKAREVWLPHGRKTAMPQSDRAFVLHLSATGYKFIDVTEGEEAAFGVFLRMLEQLDWRDQRKGRVGTVIYPPLPDGSQPSPLLEDIDGVPAVGKLAAMGVERLDDLCTLSASELLSIPGVGPGALRSLPALLALWGREVEGLAEEIARLDAEEVAKAERRVETAAKRQQAHQDGKHAAKPIRGCSLCERAAEPVVEVGARNLMAELAQSLRPDAS